MESSPSDISPVDAANDLAILEQARSSVALNPVLDFGPLWYAPAFAATAMGISLAGRVDGAVTSAVFLAIGVIAAIAVSFHGIRNLGVLPRTTAKSVLAFVPMLITMWFVFAAWGTAVSTIGEDDFVPFWAALGWVLTTAFFVVVRQVVTAIRDRQPSLG